MSDPSTASPSDVSGARAIHRAVTVIRTVARRQRSGATLSQVARDTGLSRSTTFRLLRVLTSERLLFFRQADHSYWIGPLAYELGLAASGERQQHEWRGVVEQVARQTRLTSYLIARSGDEAVCLLCVQGAAAIRAMPVEVGQRVPLGLGAGSLAILASLDDREIERVISTPPAGDDARFATAMTRGDLAARIARTRRDGYATSSGTVARGVSGVGVLLPGTGPGTPLALTVSAVTVDMSVREARTLAACMARTIGSVGDTTRQTEWSG